MIIAEIASEKWEIINYQLAFIIMMIIALVMAKIIAMHSVIRKMHLFDYLYRNCSNIHLNFAVNQGCYIQYYLKGFAMDQMVTVFAFSINIYI